MSRNLHCDDEFVLTLLTQISLSDYLAIMFKAKPQRRDILWHHHKDFGYGFYYTNLKRQAKRWALTKRGESVVNSYVYTINSDLKTLHFEGSEKL